MLAYCTGEVQGAATSGGRGIAVECHWYHATRRATTDEIEAVFANEPRIERNRRGRVTDWRAIGTTDAGRSLTVPFIYDEGAHEAWPITARENR